MSINDIILGGNKYEGYLWLSNSIEPNVYNNEVINLKLDEGVFIVEGQLYDKDGKKSYGIKYIDGFYHINPVDISESFLTLGNDKEMIFKTIDDEGKEVTSVVQRKDYLSNRMDERWLKILRFWEPRKDKNCEGMKPLVITKNAFIGFEKK